MNEAWSEKEVRAIVDDYFDMLLLELKGHTYKKSIHRNELLKSIQRSAGSIEYKHQNISAVLLELGMPYISGYKPARNYQRKVLPDIILDYLIANPHMDSTMRLDVDAEAETPTVQSILDAFVEPPKPRHVEEIAPEYKRPMKRINYLAREAANASLGAAGEKYVINFEKARLIHAGKENLSDRIEHVAVTEGDAEGYDIHSYNTDSTDRFIEAKTTRYGIHTPFYVTSNELKFSDNHRINYHLYRVFEFREYPKLFTLNGFIGELAHLEPKTYIARV